VEMAGDLTGLRGTTTVTAREGVATFDRVSFGPVVGSDVVLRFSAEGLPLVSVALPNGAEQGLWLDQAVLNGQALSPANRILHLRPGEMIRGEVTIRYSAFWPAASLVLAAVPTWGDKRKDFVTVSSLPTPVVNAVSRHSLSLAGPDAPGDYHLVLAFAAETDAVWIASGTNWGIGRPIWDDGNDLADLTTEDVAAANAQGSIHPDWIFKNGRRKGYLPTTVIEVRVR